MITSFPSMAALLLSLLVQCLLIRGIAGNKNDPGEVLPKSVELEVGHSLNLTCRMNLDMFSGEDSRSLHFYYDDTNEPVPAADIHIINETTIVYMMRNASKQDRHYTCKSGPHGVDQTHVFVGEKPLEILDFKCRSYDFVYMVCNFTKPENPVATKYDVSYYASSPNYRQDCSKPQIEYNQQVCNFTQEQNNYRLNYDLFNFIINGSNSLGSRRQTFKIDHKEIVIPARPSITFANHTTNSVYLNWTMNRFSYYERGLVYEIQIKPDNMSSYSLSPEDYDTSNVASQYSILLRNLPYAFYTYTVKLRIRIKWKKSEWSEAFVGSFKTLPQIPSGPPRIDPSGFFLINDNQLRLYWQQVPRELWNGPDFTYIIDEVKVDDRKSDLKPFAMDLASASFTWDHSHSYEFTIKSRNAVGESRDSAKISIPALPKSLDAFMPQWISHVNHSPNRTLSWEPPLLEADLIDFTVYWCQSIKEIFNDCKESLHFQHVPKDSNSFTITPHLQSEFSMNFAVAANYKDFSTGIHWSMCPADISSDLVKLKPEVQGIEADSIEIQWSLDGICTSSIVIGYNLTYCEVEQEANWPDMECLDEESFTLTIDKTKKKFKVVDLKPFTTYKIEMLMFSQEKVGSPSDALIVKTKENASSEPRDLSYKNVTSSSVWISWKQPNELNGILRFYKIIRNNIELVINCTAKGFEGFCDQDEMKFKLNNLDSFTDYVISIVAHTVKDSQASRPIHFKTLIGVPSVPGNHQAKTENDMTLFEWEAPKRPNGRLDYYEVALTILNGNKVQQEYISTVINATSCLVKIPTCRAMTFRHTLTVRAINVVLPSETLDELLLDESQNEDLQANEMNPYENNHLQCKSTSQISEEQQRMLFKSLEKYKHFHSSWSNPQIYHCTESSEKLLKNLGLVLVCLMGVTLLVLLIWRLHQKYLKMSNIKCAIPETLKTNYPNKSIVTVSSSTDEDDDDDYKKGKEISTTEAHHLLSSSLSHSNDSGYLFQEPFTLGQNGESGGGITPLSIGQSSGYSGSDHYDEPIHHHHHHHHQSHHDEQLQQQHQPSSSDYTSDVQFQFKMSDNHQAKGGASHNFDDKNTYMPMKLTNDNACELKEQDGYITAKEFTKYALPMQKFLAPENNIYVKPNKALGWTYNEPNPIFTTENSSCLPDAATLFNNGVGGGVGGGYIPPQMLNKPTNNGYTTLDALGKPPLSGVTTTTTTSMSLPASRQGVEGSGVIAPDISGYVTQKKLSEFGQTTLT